jgi:hypothetical protein
MTAVASKRNQTLKDFSDLRPIDKRIQLVAAGIYQIAFRGEANSDFMPKAGTQVHRCWKMTKLSERQQIAWQEFIDDVNLAEGISGKVTGGYGEYTDRGSDGFKVPRATINAQYKRLERLRGYLTRHELALLSELLQDHLNGKSSLQLETIGLVRSGYNDKDAARVAGIVHIQCLLDRLSSFYQL